MQKENLFKNARSQLFEAFYQVCDISRFEHLLRTYELSGSEAAAFSLLPLLGEGRHFTVYRVRLQNQSCAFGISKHKMSDTRHAPSLRSWLEALASLKNAKKPIPLIPPFVTLKGKEHLAWITPYGEDLSAAGPEWSPLADTLSYMEEALVKLGLNLDDVPQIRTWNSIPFICDLSDLKSTHYSLNRTR